MEDNKRKRDTDSDGSDTEEDKGKEKVDTTVPPKKRARKNKVFIFGFDKNTWYSLDAATKNAVMRQTYDATDVKLTSIELIVKNIKYSS